MKGYVKVCVPAAVLSNGLVRKQLDGVDVVLLVRPGHTNEDVLNLLKDLVESVTVDDTPTKLDWK